MTIQAIIPLVILSLIHIYIYANYDMDEQTVCDTLDVYLVLSLRLLR